MKQLNKFNIYLLLLYIIVLITVMQCQLMEDNEIYYKQSIKIFSHRFRNIIQVKHKNNTTQVKPEMETDSSNRKSREMCSSYAKLAYKKRKQILVNVPGATPKNESQCGDQFHPTIFGGTKAEAKEFPHMALIGFDGDGDRIDWACGGSLIAEEWVLTAAHCINFSDKTAKYVKLGELDYKDERDDFGCQLFKISKIIPHNDYNNTYYNDIALFKLETKARLNAYVRPACLWTKHEIEKKYNNIAIATGWGETSGFKCGRSEYLLKVALNLRTQQNCSCYSDKYDKEHLPEGILHDLQICAHGHFQSGTYKSTCKGDSGGPLQIFNQDQCVYYIIGVTSINKICGSSPVPGVYTRVSNYIPWIENIVWPKQ